MLTNLISSIVVFLVSMGINFFLAPFILKSLGNEAFGFVGLSNAVVAYASIITVAINSVSGRFVAFWWHRGERELANGYYSSVLVVNIFFSILVVLISAIFLLNLERILDVPQTLKQDVTLTFIFYFINFCVGLFNGVITVSIFVKNKLYLSSIRNALSSLVFAALILLLFSLFEAKIFYIALSALAASIFIFFSTIYISHKITPELKFSLVKFEFKKIKELFHSGVWNSFNALNHILLTGMDLFICNIFLGANLTGILSVAKAAPLLLEGFCAQLSGIFAPKMVELFSKGEISALVLEAKFSMRVIAFVMSAPAAFFVAFGREFYSLWLPFKSAEEIALIYELSMISFAPVILISYVFSLFNLDSATNKLRRPAIANTALGVSVILAQICVLKFTSYGLYGIVAVGALLYSVRILAFDLINAALNLELKLNTFYGEYFKNLAVFIATCALFFGARNFININGWIEFMMILFTLLIVGYAINLFLVFNRNQRRVVIAKIASKFKRKF